MYSLCRASTPFGFGSEELLATLLVMEVTQVGAFLEGLAGVPDHSSAPAGMRASWSIDRHTCEPDTDEARHEPATSDRGMEPLSEACPESVDRGACRGVETGVVLPSTSAGVEAAFARGRRLLTRILTKSPAAPPLLDVKRTDTRPSESRAAEATSPNVPFNSGRFREPISSTASPRTGVLKAPVILRP